MKQFYFLTLITFSALSIGNLKAQTIWTGPTTTFTKVNNADWTLEANQDRITSNVWLTRENNQGIFNIKIEGAGDACDSDVPGDTEWTYGTTANYSSLTYQTLGNLIGCNFSNIVDGQDMVVHLITDDIYIDIKFLSWTSGGAGGGFSYERSTDQTLGTDNFELENTIKLFPNPSSEFIQVSGLTTKVDYTIYNILGEEIKKGIISDEEEIDVKNLNSGLYFLRLDNRNTIKFMKK
jgi:hypothetical protein